jgi:hypothetical protein
VRRFTFTLLPSHPVCMILLGFLVRMVAAGFYPAMDGKELF